MNEDDRLGRVVAGVTRREWLTLLAVVAVLGIGIRLTVLFDAHDARVREALNTALTVEVMVCDVPEVLARNHILCEQAKIRARQALERDSGGLTATEVLPQ